MTPRVSIPVIRRVRMKQGASVEVLRHHPVSDRAKIERHVKGCLDAQFADGRSAGGFAFCVWDCEGASVTELMNFVGPITAAMIPDFARNLLVQRLAEKWITGK